MAKRLAPLLVILKERKPRTAGGLTSQLAPSQDFDIGVGPWFVQGEKASSAEYRVARILNRLGRRYNFQEAHFGGRTLAGGQVLDFVLTDMPWPIVVDVRGSYWHGGAEREANDVRKMLQIRASRPDAQIVVVQEEQTKNEELLYQLLLRKVGARGAGRTTA